jgi:hypothetical protein
MRIDRLRVAAGVASCVFFFGCTVGVDGPETPMLTGVCAPGARLCQAEGAVVCADDGSGFVLEAACDGSDGTFCDERSGRCVDPCAVAESSLSNVGCEYWPVTTLNPQVAEEIAFGVVIANGEPFEAHVTVERNGERVAETRVAGFGVETLTLPWVDELKGLEVTRARYTSSFARGGAYRLRSDVPVVVYQFNPLHYRIDRDCWNENRLELPTDDGECFSWSNDASLLLPTHALTGSYHVLGWPSIVNRADERGLVGYGGAPGFVTIVGVEDEPVEVSVRLGAHVLESEMPGDVPAARAGDEVTFTLAAGDVVQLASEMPEICGPASRSEMVGTQLVTYCILPEDYDLTGTEVRATGRVAVIAGHACAFVPIDQWSCDHLEEMVPPLETLSDHVVVAPTEPFRDEPNILRVMSASDDNRVRFEPPIHDEVLLGRGEMVELPLFEDVEVLGTEPLLAAQFMVGQSYGGAAPSDAGGDPSMGYAVPVEQYRDRYTFSAPDTYDESWIVVTRSAGDAVTLDGEAIDGFRSVGASGMETTRVAVPPGAHRMEGAGPFGIVVYGVGAHTSYAYPGGLDLRQITAPF